jgi:hypothetical protein
LRDSKANLPRLHLFSLKALWRKHTGLGTTAVTRLAEEPEVMAKELTGLVAAVYQAAEEMALTKATGRENVAG